MQQVTAEKVEDAIHILRQQETETHGDLHGLTLRQIELLTDALKKDPKMARKMAEMLGLLPG